MPYYLQWNYNFGLKTTCFETFNHIGLNPQFYEAWSNLNKRYLFFSKLPNKVSLVDVRLSSLPIAGPLFFERI